MKLIQELNEIVAKLEKDDNEFGIDFYESNYSELKVFLDKKLGKSFFKKRNARILSNKLDILLKYTNQTNIDWISYKVLLSQPGFMDKLLDNLDSYRFKENINELLITHVYNWMVIDNPDIVPYFFSDRLLNCLADLRLDTSEYDSFVSNMTEQQQKDFLNLLIEKKVPITFINFNFKGNNKQFINDNILYIAENSNGLYYLKNTVKSDEEALTKITDYIDKHPEQALDSIIYQLRSDVQVKDDALKDTIMLIIKDVMKNENAKFSDIDFNSGAYSGVIFIKDKVVKMGYKRATPSFPNNPYIVKPLLRKALKVDGDTCFVEVTERVDTSEKATDEELYQLYKKLRDVGLIWTDIAPKNVGRLLKDNKIYWNGNLEPENDKVLELDEYRDSDELKKGDLVILDADFIYKETDANIKYPEKQRFDTFESRYQREKLFTEEQLNSINNFINVVADITEEDKNQSK